jgi:hypothetical protein
MNQAAKGKAKTLRLSEENVGTSLHDVGLAKDS